MSRSEAEFDLLKSEIIELKAKLSAACDNELQCEDCMLLKHEEPTVSVRNSGAILCNSCHSCYYNAERVIKQAREESSLGTSADAESGLKWLAEQTAQRNPKDIQGDNRVPLCLVPEVADTWEAAVLKMGLDRNPNRTRWNWRDFPIQLSSYISALERHIASLKGGEWIDPDSGELEIPHIAFARANTGIILDAHHAGTLINDLPKKKSGAGDLLRHLKSIYEKR